MSILNIFKRKDNTEKNTEQSSNVNIERMSNKDGILEFKEVIKKVANKQKDIRKITRSSHDKTDWDVLAQFQNNERETSKWLFQANTAYYIVKHYLWLDEYNEQREAYLKKVVEDARRALKGSCLSEDKWLKEKFLDEVDNSVKEYIPNK
jgi:hypothetical protein